MALARNMLPPRTRLEIAHDEVLIGNGGRVTLTNNRLLTVNNSCAPVAQRLEQQTHNLLVRGSNPCGGTKYFLSMNDSLDGL